MYVYFLMNLKFATEWAVGEWPVDVADAPAVMSYCCRKVRRAREWFVKFAETVKPARQYWWGGRNAIRR